MSSTASFHPVQTTKRHRTSSQSSGSSSGNGPSRSGVANKASRISPPAEEGEEASAATHPLLCTLPPTCNHKPTPLANTKELESHYATYHAHVCEQQGCGCVFPDARLLELHQTENHDPLAAMRKERGDKIFACHLASCPKLFANPKGRRLHLISAHGYPKEYFFAVTNKGVGGLLKKWGEGASMVRGKWTPREPATTSSGPDAAPQQVVDRSTMRGSATSSGMDVDDDDESDSDEEEVEEDPLDDDDEVVLVTSSRTPDIKAFTTSKTESNRMNLDQDPEATPRPYANSSLPPIHSTPASRTADPASASADKLAAGFSTLSLVPPSVRFGRGGREAAQCWIPAPSYHSAIGEHWCWRS
ncbi:hypothetical protein DFP72DRAFT_842588 [Ephemerocybe angulata]|uniref:C2H2-type domain-containing protein n=1 Tax=Ephemerocybe angulata TaxID=980116 RepID=A0A8H6MF55_9AGAR|nr:hypothetical protein DFP72DRAFT_842588 [Tulosesus angulatus]